MTRKIIGMLMASLLGMITMAAQANQQLEAEIKTYTAAFTSGSFAQMKDVLDELEWKGISDTRLYDAMLEQFNKSKANTDKAGLDQTAYLARGLARSGNDKYKKVIEDELAKEPHKKLVRHYTNALEEFAVYARQNAIISANLENAKDIHVQRVRNMLGSDQPEIMVIGAKRVYYAHYTDKELLDLTAKRLQDVYASADDNASIDAAAWLCKALAKSGMAGYKEVLTKVADTATNKKLKKYASQAADAL